MILFQHLSWIAQYFLLAGKRHFLKLTISGYRRPSFMLGSEVLNLISAVCQSCGTIPPSQVCPELC